MNGQKEVARVVEGRGFGSIMVPVEMETRGWMRDEVLRTEKGSGAVAVLRSGWLLERFVSGLCRVVGGVEEVAGGCGCRFLQGYKAS
jgi:hypothetical protein